MDLVHVASIGLRDSRDGLHCACTQYTPPPIRWVEELRKELRPLSLPLVTLRSPILRARARVFRDESTAFVEIEDDGPGIPPEDADRVFEPFYRREPSRSRQTGGIGLGLAVVRSVARGHGGDVALVNRMGGGLTARVQLPL